MKAKLLAMLMLTAILLALLTSGCTSCPQVGGKAPDFTLKTPEGGITSLNDFSGSLVIINFWATNCGPCVAEMPHLQAIYEKLSNQGLTVLALNVYDDAATIREFVSRNKLTFPVLLDTQMEVFQKFCLPQAIPITLFINREGTIKAQKIGAFQSPNEIESLVKSL